MNPDYDLELIDMMDKYNISYSEALDRCARKQNLLDLAEQRKKAHKIKTMLNRQKQKRFREASKQLHNDAPNDQQAH